jgi:hypothetical protein
MPRKILVVLLALALSACATSNGPPPSTGGGDVKPSGPTASASGWAVAIIGTPFALAFKTVVCGASLVVAAPVAGFLTLGTDPSGEGYRVLSNGLATNCGPPYVVSPSAAS